MDKYRRDISNPSICERLHQTRINRGMSQAYLAAEIRDMGIKCSRQAISAYETGNRAIPLDTFAAMCSALDEDPSHVLYGVNCQPDFSAKLSPSELLELLMEQLPTLDERAEFLKLFFDQVIDTWKTEKPTKKTVGTGTATTWVQSE